MATAPAPGAGVIFPASAIGANVGCVASATLPFLAVKPKNGNSAKNRKIGNEIGTTFGVRKLETTFGVPKSEMTFGVPKIKKMENRCSRERERERERERDLPSSSGGCEGLLLQEVARLQLATERVGEREKKEWGREKRREKAIVLVPFIFLV